MSWVKLLLPLLLALIEWAKNKSDERRLKEVIKDEREKRMALEREVELARRADADLDARRRTAGWTGGGDPGDRSPDTRRD